MKLKKAIFFFGIIMLLGCSSDDEGPQEEQTVSIGDFTVIGEDADNVYLFDFNGNTEQGERTDLTAELNVTPNYLTLRETGDLLSFYFFSQGAFSLVFRDIRTGASATYTDFFANSEGRSVAWGINNESNVLFGFFGPPGTRNFGIQDVDLRNFIGLDTAIDVDIDFVFQPVLFGNRAFFAYRNNNGDYKFTYYDLDQQVGGPILNFEDVPISFLITASDDIAIIKNGFDASIEVYDPSSLALLETHPLGFNTGFSAGPVDGAVFDGSVLYYAFPYVQPSKFAAGPALFDLEKQENQLLDFFGIADGVEQELGSTIGLTVQIYDPLKEVFLVGYEILDQSATGGVLQIDKGGELIANTVIDFVPTYFIRN